MILIVDDSELIIQRLIDMLKEVENVDSIIHAHNYAEADTLLQCTNIHVVVLDINLPTKSGVELLKYIKRDYPQIKVIMFTNNASNYHRALCEQLDADYFIDKSNDFEMIPSIIATLN